MAYTSHVAAFIQHLIDIHGDQHPRCDHIEFGLMSESGLAVGRNSTAFVIREIGSPPVRYTVVVERMPVPDRLPGKHERVVQAADTSVSKTDAFGHAGPNPVPLTDMLKYLAERGG